MIEQTELVVSEWIFMPPAASTDAEERIISLISLDVMRKTAPTKKGLACRFTCKCVKGKDTVLLYTAEDSYVIDLDDVIDKHEVLKMIKNSYSKFKETFDFRKLGTILQDTSMAPLNEYQLNVDAIVPLLN